MPKAKALPLMNGRLIRIVVVIITIMIMIIVVMILLLIRSLLLLPLRTVASLCRARLGTLEGTLQLSSALTQQLPHLLALTANASRQHLRRLTVPGQSSV